MAFLKRRTLGAPVGKLGDQIFKSLHQETIIASVPLSFHTPMDSGSIARRTKFRFMIKLSSAIFRLISVKIFWKRVLPAGKAVCTQIFKSNYDRVDSNLNLSAVMLTQLPSFGVANTEINISADKVTISADALGAASGIDTGKEKKISCEGVLYLSNPVDSFESPYQFIPLHSIDKDIVLNDPLAFDLFVQGADQVMLQKYQAKKVLLALVTKDSVGNPVNSSVTLSN